VAPSRPASPAIAPVRSPLRPSRALSEAHDCTKHYSALHLLRPSHWMQHQTCDLAVHEWVRISWAPLCVESLREHTSLRLSESSGPYLEILSPHIIILLYKCTKEEEEDVKRHPAWPASQISSTLLSPIGSVLKMLLLKITISLRPQERVSSPWALVVICLSFSRYRK
jgi:hypothetical protein